MNFERLRQSNQSVLQNGNHSVNLQYIRKNHHLVIVFAHALHLTAMEDFDILQDWVEAKMIRGQYIFTKDDVLAIGLPLSNDALINSLVRLGKRGVIMSPWHNFYVIVATEYKLKGVVPPAFYIDKLMKFIGRDYYVALLSAAAFNGASHQKSMVFQTMVNGGSIRSGIKSGTRLEFTIKKRLPMKFVHQMKSQTGYMNVADAELTAFDIVAEEHKIGGLSRAAEVLTELSEVMSFDDNKQSLLEFFTSAAVQRLGYLLDYIGESTLADELFLLLGKSGKAIRRVPLKQSLPITGDMSVNARWKVIENYELEIDDI